MPRLPLLLLCLATCLTSGCAGFDHADRAASLTVTNLSDMPVCGVYLSRSGRLTPGTNRLPEGEPIDPQRQRTFFLAAGAWDLRLDDCEGAALFARQGLSIRGSHRVVFRPVEVQRVPGRSTRRCADAPPSKSWL